VKGLAGPVCGLHVVASTLQACGGKHILQACGVPPGALQSETPPGSCLTS